MTVRVRSADGCTVRRPLGLKHREVALPNQIVLEFENTLLQGQVPDDDLAVMSGTKDNVA